MVQTVYIDNSVFGGCFDDEFSKYSNLLFKEIKIGKFKPVISDLTILEIEQAPDFVQKVLKSIKKHIEILYFDEEADELAFQYISEGKLSKKLLIDARQIAIASINKIDIIVSWNFKHIVNLDRIKLYNSVNLKNGYPLIEIRSPRDIIHE